MRWLALLLILSGCASQQPPEQLVRIDRLVNARPYTEMREGFGAWPLPIDGVNCAGYAAWKYAALRLRGYHPVVIIYQPSQGRPHAIVKVDGWMLDSDPRNGPSPRPWTAPAHGYWQSGLTFMAKWSGEQWSEL